MSEKLEFQVTGVNGTPVIIQKTGPLDVDINVSPKMEMLMSKEEMMLQVLSSVAGAKGDSMYDIAVRHGYTGTEEEFIEEFMSGGSVSGFYNVDNEHPLSGGYYTLSTAVEVVANDPLISDETKNGMIIMFWSGEEWEIYKYKLVYDPENPGEFADVNNWEMFDDSGTTVTTTDQIYDRHLDKTQDVINAELSERTFRKFPTRADFPLIGKNNTLYMDRETGFMYTWETNHYEMAGDTWRNIKMIIGNTDVVLE